MFFRSICLLLACVCSYQSARCHKPWDQHMKNLATFNLTGVKVRYIYGDQEFFTINKILTEILQKQWSTSGHNMHPFCLGAKLSCRDTSKVWQRCMECLSSPQPFCFLSYHLTTNVRKRERVGVIRLAASVCSGTDFWYKHSGEIYCWQQTSTAVVVVGWAGCKYRYRYSDCYDSQERPVQRNVCGWLMREWKETTCVAEALPVLCHASSG